ncbi:MAG: tetratricopeptide repeat protein [Verrucomicrobiaceae bacterium]|nr:MAG: tetratricopeptide repeat protein [Verrucomicrobiaceae bacterium]
MSQTPFALYNPALLPADLLLDEFTARQPLLEILLGVVRSNLVGQPPQHCLLIGARGMGKTTTLWAIAHRASRDPELRRLWQPVVFDEESRRIGDLADFWLEAIRQWEHTTSDQADRAGQLLINASADIEDRARQTFESLMKSSGKRALLLIDNLNDVLGSIRDLNQLHRLRAFLMRDSGVMVIGGATSYFEEITSIDQPFYDFFRYFELKPLTLEEMRECLLNLARTRGDLEVEKTITGREGSIRALHLFTGGNPRLVKTFYRLLRDGLHTDIRADLEKLLDEFTPYFKAIVDALPVQQQRIFDAVALAWDPVEVSRLVTATRLPSNQISAQLRSLTKIGLVRQATGNPKRKTYLLSDRFSNIHYLMRHGRAARNRLDWFVATVRILFPDKESSDILAKLAHDAAGNGPLGLQDARDVLQSALNRAESAEIRCQLLNSTIERSWAQDTWHSIDCWFDFERAKQDLPEMEILEFCQQMPAGLRKKLGYKPDSAEWWYELTKFLTEKSAWKLAEQAYQKSLELDPINPITWAFLGDLLSRKLNKPTEAEAAFRNTIHYEPRLYHPWFFLGDLLERMLRFDEAEAAFRKALEIKPDDADSWTRLGSLLEKCGSQSVEVEIAFRTAVELQPGNAYSWTRLGRFLEKNPLLSKEAETAFRTAIELQPDDAYTWTRLGGLLEKNPSRLDEAETAFRTAFELQPSDTYPLTRLGSLLGKNSSRLNEAEAVYRKSISIAPDDGFALFKLAILLAERAETKSEAERLAVRLLLLEPTDESNQFCFLLLCKNLAEAWAEILPEVTTWCIKDSKNSQLFHFVIDGFIRYARLKNTTDALALLEKNINLSPFESLRDAFIADINKSHLQTLAPERKEVAIELMQRIHQDQ